VVFGEIRVILQKSNICSDYDRVNAFMLRKYLNELRWIEKRV